MTIDWSKPIEYISTCSLIPTRPARLVCSDRKGPNPFVILYTTEDGNEFPITVSPDGCQKPGNAHQYIRNVPPPAPPITKKKMYRAEISKTTSRILVSERPLIQFANGELSGWQGWKVDKLEEVEV